jgi:hypothetical protein
MESIKKSDFTRVLKAWAYTYFSREKADVGNTWFEARVMGHIRAIGSVYIKPNYFELYQQFLWRLFPVACILAVTLAVILFRMDFISDYELAKIFINDPKDFIMLAMNN